MKHPGAYIRRVLELRLFFVVNVVALLILSLSFGREYLRSASIEEDIDELRAEKAALETKNLELLNLSETIQTQYFLEREGRLKHGLQESGERLVIVSPDLVALTSEATENGADAASGPERITNPKRWWYYFFDRVEYESLKRYELGS